MYTFRIQKKKKESKRMNRINSYFFSYFKIMTKLFCKYDKIKIEQLWKFKMNVSVLPSSLLSESSESLEELEEEFDCCFNSIS